MQVATVRKFQSDEFRAIYEWFRTTPPPYCLHDILNFNYLYKQAYPVLSREEKRRIEEFVDSMIDNVECPKLVKCIYGVV
jgi:hypothetical protein